MGSLGPRYLRSHVPYHPAKKVAVTKLPNPRFRTLRDAHVQFEFITHDQWCLRTANATASTNAEQVAGVTTAANSIVFAQYDLGLLFEPFYGLEGTASENVVLARFEGGGSIATLNSAFPVGTGAYADQFSKHQVIANYVSFEVTNYELFDVIVAIYCTFEALQSTAGGTTTSLSDFGFSDIVEGSALVNPEHLTQMPYVKWIRVPAAKYKNAMRENTTFDSAGAKVTGAVHFDKPDSEGGSLRKGGLAVVPTVRTISAYYPVWQWTRQLVRENTRVEPDQTLYTAAYSATPASIGRPSAHNAVTEGWRGNIVAFPADYSYQFSNGTTSDTDDLDNSIHVSNFGLAVNAVTTRLTVRPYMKLYCELTDPIASSEFAQNTVLDNVTGA